jgi:Dna[CI] antecedent, DciA
MRSAAHPVPPPAHSVKDLLGRASPGLTRVTDQAARASFWNQWLTAHLAPEIRARVSGVVERDGELVIFAESAAWCARLRFMLLELEPDIRSAAPAITAVVARVLPRR